MGCGRTTNYRVDDFRRPPIALCYCYADIYVLCVVWSTPSNHSNAQPAHRHKRAHKHTLETPNGRTPISCTIFTKLLLILAFADCFVFVSLIFYSSTVLFLGRVSFALAGILAFHFTFDSAGFAKKFSLRFVQSSSRTTFVSHTHSRPSRLGLHQTLFFPI